ncbi:HpcH/HpaI aldolase/citrate lyase family protein [Nakamurella leprariae]|uniref:CoA ester lyase n=1 Tax=Nakamurella leprariae TaxID=2803911 RepID=A0A939BXX6_9ACTN|nr:CoA ester lyase [Nakamurella leprariae]MBM9466465.1 CoA ester lyase [Nakamurella leprariae]
MSRIPRSYLYVPGDQPDKLAKAARSGADALILDLEDAVSRAGKPLARDAVRASLDTVSDSDDVERWVRINADSVTDDLPAVVMPALTGVVVPKAEPELLAQVDRWLGAAGSGARVIAIIESARGLALATQVASAPRVIRLGVGEADLAAELGLIPDRERTEMAWARGQIVLASAVVGLTRPIGPVLTDLGDPDLLVASTRALARQGFRARTALTPRQLPVINETFTPSDAEVADATAVLQAWEAASGGVAVTAGGAFIDAAVVRSAQDVLSRAR